MDHYILGISAFYHDSGACLLKDGQIIAAAQEERFSRKKHDASFPKYAIEFCISAAGIDGKMIADVVFYEKPFLKFERLLETYLAFAPRGYTSFAKSMPSWVKDKLFQRTFLTKALADSLGREVDWGTRLLFSEHHLSHAASAFYPSPFENTAVLTLDGVGEWTTTSLAIGHGSKLDVVKEIKFPHSLGLLYSAFTFYLGFKVNSGEYKVMGLAPYGEPRYVDLILEHVVNLAQDGSFQLDMSYFDFATKLRMTSRRFHELFGGEPRIPETELSQRDMDLASSIQKVTEIILLRMARAIAKDTGQRNLCLAGGVALNCVANGILLREKIFDDIWVQPAAGDAGGALGAALAVWHLHYGKARSSSGVRDEMRGSYLGPEYTDEQIESELKSCGAVFDRLSESELIDWVVEALEKGLAIGWMQGRMEFGPRALGSRSIIADARSSDMQKQLNLKVKYRESFRPFAPSVLDEDVSEWFKFSGHSPYMLVVTEVKEDKRCKSSEEEASLFGIDRLNISRSFIPAVTHVDYSARLQTVHSDTNPQYFKLISKFKQRTGCPVLVNTSFNVRGEPIVCSPTDAFNCFMGTDLDVLAVGNFFLAKDRQREELKSSYVDRYEPD